MQNMSDKEKELRASPVVSDSLKELSIIDIDKAK